MQNRASLSLWDWLGLAVQKPYLRAGVMATGGPPVGLMPGFQRVLGNMAQAFVQAMAQGCFFSSLPTHF